MKKNLIFFMSDFSFGGAGNSISKLCINLPKKDYRISVICIGKCEYKKLFERNKINVYQLKNRKLIFSIFSIRRILKKILKKNYKNILISNIHYNNIILTLIAKQINNLKIILVERTPLQELDIYFSKFDFLKKKIVKFLIRVLYPKSDIIIVNSNGIKNGFSKSLIKKVKVIYPPALRNVNKLQKKFKKNSSLKAVCFSRLSKEKNLECAIKSFKFLENKNISLTIYGDGILRENLVGLISSLDLKKKVVIKKLTNFPQEEMRKFDILISSSFFEGCSNTIIEALNNKLIVIASNCPGGNAEILNYGKSGLLFQTDNEHDLYLKVKRVINNFNFFLNKSNKYRNNLKRFLLKSNLEKFSKTFENI
tara:strand:+ start:11140 stop:12237 length:1098 start_codon:yes stop_codon:yes gene_type:complete